MMKFQRIFAAFLTLVLLVSMIPVMQLKAQAYTTPGKMTTSELNNKILQLRTMLEGKYFTTTGSSCGNNACDACKNVNVFTATWFKNLFGTVTGDQLPTQAYPYGITGTAVGWTCHGFASFAQWYLFATSPTDKVTNYRVVDNVTMTRANMLKYAKPGDIIRYTYNTTYGYGHSVIFLEANETTYTVLDNNFGWNGDAKSRVRTHTISYNSSIPMAISRANNYPTGTALTMSFSANGGSIAEGSYQVKTATPGTILRLRNSPSLSGTYLLSIPDATVLTVTETATADGYTWGKVTYDGTTGWCAISGGLTERQGYYLENQLIYQYSTSTAYNQSWDSGGSGTLVKPEALGLSREGYAFLGWSTRADGTGPLFSTASSLKTTDICPEAADSDQSLTLYAIWEDLNPKVLTFDYDGSGVAGSMPTQQVKPGEPLTLEVNGFYRQGDTFLGWYLQSEDGLWYTGNGWDIQQKALLMDGETIVPDDSFTGLSYTFRAVWKNDGITGISIQTQPNRVKYTLNSQFDPTGLTIKVHYDNGTSELLTQGFTVGQPQLTQIGTVDIPVEYWGFTAWTSVQVYEPAVVSVGAVSGYLDEVVSLPIVYTGNNSTQCTEFTLTLMLNSSVVCKGYSVPEGMDPSQVRLNLSQTDKVTVTYTGTVSTATIWLHLQIVEDTQTVISVQNALCTDKNGASWEMEGQAGTVTSLGLLTVTYNGNQGSNAPASAQVRYGQQLTITTAAPVRQGYSFLGWSTFPNSSVPQYRGGDKITCLTDTVLYAVWKQDVVIVQPTLTLEYPTVSFEDEIKYNIYYQAANTGDVVEMGLVTFSSKLADGTIYDAVDRIAGFAGSDGSYMVHTNGIPAKNLGDALYFKVYAKLSDGSYVYSSVAGYNAVAYAKTVLSSTSASKSAKALMVAMLNYGTASQLHFGYKTDALINDFLTPAGKALVSDYYSGMMDPVVAADSARAGHFVMNKTAFTGAYPTVSFEGAFSINYYFTTGLTPDNGVTFCYWDAETYENTDRLTTANATGLVKMSQDGDRWYAAVEGIAAKDMDKTVYVAAIYKSGGTTYTTSVIAYSLGKYCQTMAASGNELGAAAAVYGYYAKAYFA